MSWPQTAFSSLVLYSRGRETPGEHRSRAVLIHFLFEW